MSEPNSDESELWMQWTRLQEAIENERQRRSKDGFADPFLALLMNLTPPDSPGEVK